MNLGMPVSLEPSRQSYPLITNNALLSDSSAFFQARRGFNNNMCGWQTMPVGTAMPWRTLPSRWAQAPRSPDNPKTPAGLNLQPHILM